MRPFLIKNLLHREKLDPNRKLEDACHPSCPVASAAWTEYHTRVEVAVAFCVARFGFCHIFDIHGQSHRAASELGYLVRTSDLLESDDHLNRPALALRSSVASLVERGSLVTDILRGPYSLGALLENRGYAAFPSHDHGYPATDKEIYFWGSYTTWRFGTRADLSGDAGAPVSVSGGTNIRFGVKHGSLCTESGTSRHGGHETRMDGERRTSAGEAMRRTRCLPSLEGYTADGARPWGPGNYGPGVCATQVETDARVRRTPQDMVLFANALAESMILFLYHHYHWCPSKDC